MNEVRTLFEQFWICKDSSKEDYYKVKRDIPQFQRFVREQLGWKLIHTENLLKLEKIPAHAESFMGIQEFSEILDYCILCVVLMYLEDKEEGEQFLLSELIDYVETKLKGEILLIGLPFRKENHCYVPYSICKRCSCFGYMRGVAKSSDWNRDRKYYMKIHGIPSIFPQAFPWIYLILKPGRILKKRGLKKFRRIEVRQGLTVYTGSLRYVLLCIGKVMRMRILYT